MALVDDKPPGKPGPSIFLPKQPKRTPMLASLFGLDPRSNIVPKLRNMLHMPNIPTEPLDEQKQKNIRGRLAPPSLQSFGVSFVFQMFVFGCGVLFFAKCCAAWGMLRNILTEPKLEPEILRLEFLCGEWGQMPAMLVLVDFVW